MTPAQEVLIWDESGPPPAQIVGPRQVWAWRSYSSSGQQSIPRYLEDHAQRIRDRYLACIFELGETLVAGRRVIDHLALEDGFSLWWMTLLAEKSPLKSPAIYTYLRLLALEEMLRERRPASVLIVSGDQGLIEAAAKLCTSLGIGSRVERVRLEARRWSPRSIYDSLPEPLKGLLSLRHVLKRWPLRAARQKQHFDGPGAIFIGSYFIHLEAVACRRGEFHSRQWELLPKLMQAAGRRLNWIHLFLFSSVVPDTATGLDWVGRFNAAAREQGHHEFVDSFLTARRVAEAFWLWCRLAWTGWRLRAIESALDPAGCAAWLWPALRTDWKSSLSGTTAMSNCLALALFDAALSSMPRQPLGLYLCENQAWEKALLRAWRKHGHGEIIGVQHATVPFWHLYYFNDPRCFSSGDSAKLPLPDRLAVNGAAARKAITDSGYPAGRIVDSEALRYLHLARPSTTHRSARPAPQEQAGPAPDRKPVRVLVLGDLIPSSMHHLLGVLEAAMPFMPDGVDFTLKPHPGLAVDLGAYPGLRAAQTGEALGAILGNFDLAIAANCTSAAVEAYIAGLPVIVTLDAEELNLSPLRGERDVRFACDGHELADALRGAVQGLDAQSRGRQEFFYLDIELPRWKRLLGVNATA